MDLTVAVGAYGLMSAFFSKDVGGGLGLAVEGRGELLSMGLELRAVFPAPAVADQPVAGAQTYYNQEFELSQATMLLVPCIRWKYIAGCGVLQGGVMLLYNFETQTHDVFGASVGLGPRFRVEVPITEQFAVFGFGEVLFSPWLAGVEYSKPSVNPEDGPPPNTYWQQPVASAFFGVGFNVSFK